jgi:hypothetical protein
MADLAVAEAAFGTLEAEDRQRIWTKLVTSVTPDRVYGRTGTTRCRPRDATLSSHAPNDDRTRHPGGRLNGLDSLPHDQ